MWPERHRRRTPASTAVSGGRPTHGLSRPAVSFVSVKPSRARAPAMSSTGSAPPGKALRRTAAAR